MRYLTQKAIAASLGIATLIAVGPLQPAWGQVEDLNDPVTCSSNEAIAGYNAGRCRRPVIAASTEITSSPYVAFPVQPLREEFAFVTSQRVSGEIAQLQAQQAAYFARWTANQPVAINQPLAQERQVASGDQIQCPNAYGAALRLCVLN